MTRPQPERRSEPEPDVAGDPAFGVVLVRPGAGNARIASALWAVAALIAVAIVKPWGIGEPAAVAPVRLATAPTTSATPAPTADLTADGIAAPICLGPGSWRIASLERWRTQDVRVWRAIEPVLDASGPLDPAIPSVPVVAVELEALGWCAPAYGPGRPAGPASVVAWFVVDGVATELDLLQVAPEGGPTALAALYEPHARCDPSVPCPSLFTRSIVQPWTTGRVVFRHADEGTSRVAWLAADIEIIGIREGASPTPGAAR